MSREAAVREAFKELNNVSEVELKYKNGNKTTYSFKHKESREEAVTELLAEVNWDRVEEVELKHSGGKKKKINLVNDSTSEQLNGDKDKLIGALDEINGLTEQQITVGDATLVNQDRSVLKRSKGNSSHSGRRRSSRRGKKSLKGLHVRKSKRRNKKKGG